MHSEYTSSVLEIWKILGGEGVNVNVNVNANVENVNMNMSTQLIINKVDVMM